MAEDVKGLILPIGADPTQFDKSIKQVKDAYKDLVDKIQNTPFNLVSSEDRANLEGYARTIKSLENELSKVDGSSKNARTALTSLSLVAQDAPFGFIAIQNNLPNVIQSFGELSKTSGGLKGALSQVGSALVGPAGIFLAFSAVTAAVTFLIKEYGSLNNAIQAFVTGNSAAVKSQNEFNKAYLDSAKSIGAEEAQIKVLTQTLLSENSTQKQRLEAYRLLKQINPDIVAGINEQNLATDKSRRLIESAALVQIEYLKLRAQEGAISKVLDGLKEQEFLANAKLNQAKQDEIDLKNRIIAIDKKVADGIPLTSQERTTSAQRISLQKEYAQAVIDARKPLIDIINEQENWTRSLGKSYNRIAEISSNVKTLSDGLKEYEDGLKNLNKYQLTIDQEDLEDAYNVDKIISNLTKYANILLDTSKNELERKDAIQKLIDINPEYFKGLSTEKSGLTVVKDRVEQLIRTYQILRKEREFAARASKINAEFLKNELKGITEPIDLTDKYNLVPEIKPIKFDELVDASFDLEKIAKPIKALRDLQTELDITGAILNYKTNITSLGEVYKLTFSELVEKNKELASSIQGFLYQPLENIFDILLEKGKKSWKEFGNSIIATLKRIAAQIAATFIAKGIANIIAPGLGSISKGALGEWLGQDFNDITGGLAMNDIRPGGMQMSGQVVFVQRGSDLVGVLNRTNGTINRVG